MNDYTANEIIRKLKEEKQELLDICQDMLDALDGLDCNIDIEAYYGEHYRNFKNIKNKAVKILQKCEGDNDD